VPNLPAVFNQLARSGLDLVFPLECLGCHAGGQLWCSACVAKQPKLEPPFCSVCGEPGSLTRCDGCRFNHPEIDGIRAPFLMQGVLRELIHRFKYRNLRSAAPLMGQLLADYLSRHPLPGRVIVPVPLHPRRHRQRGYNQAELLARELSKRTALPVAAGLLARRQDAPTQVQSGSRQQRANNVRGSFACLAGAGGLEVLVVDDVSTTGSTLSECASVLKKGGAVSVWGLALARGA
jgi:ComF family protein